MKKILVLNGPNLNRLGKREPEIYGRNTLEDIQIMLDQVSSPMGVKLEHYQSNHEGALIDRIYEAADAGFKGVIFNPGAYTHTSIALRDAIAGSGMSFIEVHISNIYKREEFRQHSYTAGVSTGVISGLGIQGYMAALHYLAMHA
jgi:3-dehydroquinate dehydratase-2